MSDGLFIKKVNQLVERDLSIQFVLCWRKAWAWTLQWSALISGGEAGSFLGTVLLHGHLICGFAAWFAQVFNKVMSNTGASTE